MTFETCLPGLDILVRSIASKYHHLTPLSYNGLVQEGKLAALKGFKRWMTNQQSNKKTASIKTWTYIYVTSRFKELAGKKSRETASDVSEVESEIEANEFAVNLYFPVSSEKTGFKCILQSQSLSSGDAAERLGRTPRRISQIENTLVNLWEDEKGDFQDA